MSQNAIRKVVIADDENLICQMIVKMVDWARKGMVVCGTANDGVTVLNLIEKEHPDILITDIRMPGMDGLELIRQAKDIDPELSFIIISGYRSFDYAHTALTLGVNHYLLKPIDEKELEDTLDQILEEKSSKEESIARNRNSIIEETRKQSRRHFLSEIIHRQAPYMNDPAASQEDREVYDGGNAAGMDGIGIEAEEAGEGLYQALYVKLDTGRMETSYEMLNSLRYIMEQVYTEFSCEYVNSMARSGVITVLNYPSEEGFEIHHLGGMLLERLQHEADKFEDYTVTIGIGSKKNSIRDVESSVEEAVTAIKCRIRKGCGRVIYYDELRYPSMPLSDYLTPARKRRMEQLVESLDVRAFGSEMHEFNIYIQQRADYNPKLVYDFLEAAEAVIKEVLQQNGVSGQTLDHFHLQVEEALDSQVDLDALLFQFTNACGQVFNTVLDDRKQAADLPVRKAKRYMEEHYRENITLDDVAREVGWSAAYLSLQFGRSTGVGFNDYLTLLRLEEAKNLLKTTDQPITQIGEAVGYADHRYFSRVFRKNVGLKPSEYRKLYQ